MPVSLEQVAAQVGELSLPDRQRLLQHLIRDLEPEDEVVSQEEITRAWTEEISRRLEEIDSGRVKTVPAGEVFARIQTRLDEAR
jgi:putative addiction module component (TIGR02574 family)